MENDLRGLVYVGDPMCSWCWGFAPVVESLAKDFSVEIVVGGLRPGPSARALDDRMTDYLRNTWTTIAERTGQSFDTGFLDGGNEGWLYDTEPAAIAVTQMRDLNEPETLNYFTSVQHAFYVEGADVTDFDVLADIAEDLSVDRKEFRRGLETEGAKRRAWSDFSRSRNWGIAGFPALVGELDGDRLALLASGWTDEKLIRTRIDSLKEQV